MSKKDINREEHEWQHAFALRKDLAPYIQTGFRTLPALQDFCRAYECSRATAYRWLKRAQVDDSASGLRRRKPGRKPLSIALSDEHERIIEAHFRKHFLSRNKVSPTKLLKGINDDLFGRGLTTISKDAIKERISSKSDRLLTRRRHGSKAARQEFQIIRDSYAVENALDVVQIDHTTLDIMVVDPETRECIGRPYLTLLLDVATRMPTGIYLSMDAPSATNLMMAFQHSVFPKAEYLRSLGIRHEWPAYGLPLTISSDNGSDLKSKAFNRGLDEYGVEHVFRPVGQPHLGGHVERFFRTIAEFIHTLPGTTFSSIEKKGTYQPEKHAELTLGDVEKLLTNFILGDYVHDRKRRLLTTPLNMWNVNWRERDALPRLPQDPARFRLDFLPFETRRIQREGVELFGMFYRSSQLQKMKNCAVRSVTIKYNPTDIRMIYISADNRIYHHANSEHRFSRPVSVAEWKEQRRRKQEYLQRSEVPPDPSISYELHKQVLDNARNLKRRIVREKTGSLPPARDIRNLGRPFGQGGLS